MSESTAGETLFERYLRDRGIDFDPDVPAGTKNVDFRLKTTPVVFCEVKDCGIGDAEKAEAEAFAKGHSVYISTPDFYGRLRDAIRKAARQLRRAKGSPCVVVLHNNGSSVLFYESFIWGAMFGGHVTRVPLDGEPVTTFTGNRVLGEKTNTTVSAVAVLSPTFANPELIERAAASARQSGDTRDIARAFVALSDEAPEAFAQTPCLRVHHNPFANTRLPRSVFNGARDLNLWPDFLPGPFAQPEDRG